MARRSKLKTMAAEGSPWAIETLAKARAQTAAGHWGISAEAMRDAEDILGWTLGPSATRKNRWRVRRLALALSDGR